MLIEVTLWIMVFYGDLNIIFYFFLSIIECIKLNEQAAILIWTTGNFLLELIMQPICHNESFWGQEIGINDFLIIEKHFWIGLDSEKKLF